MKRLIFLILVTLLPIGADMGVNAQELTVSDIEFIDVGYNDEPPVIILTKEGPALHVHIMNYSAHPDTEEFVITPKISDGSDGEPCSVSIGVSYINYSYTAVITTFNVSFNVYGIEANSFYFSCWWAMNGMYDGGVQRERNLHMLLCSEILSLTIREYRSTDNSIDCHIITFKYSLFFLEKKIELCYLFI